MKELIFTVVAFFFLVSAMWSVGLSNIIYNSNSIGKRGRGRRSNTSISWKEKRLKELKIAQEEAESAEEDRNHLSDRNETDYYRDKFER